MNARRARGRAALAADLLAVDVGNSKVRAVLWRAGEETGRWRLDTRGLSQPARRRLWHAALASARALGAGGVPVLACGVAPREMDWIADELRRARLRPVRIAGASDPWPFEIAVREPRGVGADRLANVAGLVALGARRGVAVDAGTAVTVNVLRDGRFVGGLILPGFGLAARALHEHTALLPEVEVPGPIPELGVETRSALQAGIAQVLGQGLLAVVRRLGRELGPGARLVATGGDGGILAAAAPRLLAHEPDLQLLGLRCLAARPAPRRRRR